MRSRTLTALAVLTGLALAVFFSFRRAPHETRVASVADAASDEVREAPPERGLHLEVSSTAYVSASAPALPSIDASATPPTRTPGVLASARWGSGRGELGRNRPQEGNPEGPMSLVASGHELLVLDQVNGRVVRYDDRGRPIGSSDAPATAQDMAVAADGTIALLDRLASKSVTLTDRSGRKIGDLSVANVDPGTVTGVFIDGKEVYVEKQHGALVSVGTTDGTSGGDPLVLSGRPSKDGALLLTAGITSAGEGRTYLNAFDRQKQALRFARAIQFARPAHLIVLLDSDARGVIYLGVTAGPSNFTQIACLDPGDGHVIARTELPALDDSAEESFRDLSVAPDGTIVFAVRSDTGVEYRTATCG